MGLGEMVICPFKMFQARDGGCAVGIPITGSLVGGPGATLVGRTLPGQRKFLTCVQLAGSLQRMQSASQHVTTLGSSLRPPLALAQGKQIETSAR